MYQGGFCASSQYDETLRWFQFPAAQGHPEALLAVGLMHELGHGVPADGAQKSHRRSSSKSAVKSVSKSASKRKNRVQSSAPTGNPFAISDAEDQASDSHGRPDWNS
jgi:hypothetical protein